MSTLTISAADVNKLRLQTGAGMMDCKKALTEAEGDFEKAIDYLRKKGQKVAANRSDRDAKEGLVIAKTTADGKKGVVIWLTCETDFVSKNEAFGTFANSILDFAVNNGNGNIEDLLNMELDGVKLSERIIEQVGKIGEKIELAKYETVEAAKVVAYNHPGNRIATIVGFNKETSEQVGKDVAMQIAAMAPVAVDKSDVAPETLARELEIAKETTRAEGKPEDMVEKIALGKVNKFYKESTLLNQEFIKDSKLTVGQYLDKSEKGLTATAFKRVALA